MQWNVYVYLFLDYDWGAGDQVRHDDYLTYVIITVMVHWYLILWLQVECSSNNVWILIKNHGGLNFKTFLADVYWYISLKNSFIKSSMIDLSGIFDTIPYMAALPLVGVSFPCN